ncbi:uncharacterized protein NECHADRAFT_88204 [Fusarium vanettenii 77-13-4]|uniref:DUF3669 domain-containing protein n=1 Tax=Fusarium vanettenii (strain ATCC MYA-4622 / CBS 123669 / FGSC 9596 / NRRL 45880 / 77-13-4) TaxID=660122 RepID=C7ZDH8_FUSV7|nr:uncharacterized protein NECHADRAFT_88204 [Fusarium vanettenii 77-13-4]EEU37784.1 hypothetical protein NECHADRAFT_88204 [Fusarium vanettenii 77-13-4]
MSDASEPPRHYLESTLDDLPPSYVLLNALKTGVSIFPDSHNLNAPGGTDKLIELDYGSRSCVVHKPGQPFVVKKLHPRFGFNNHQLAKEAATEAMQTNEVFEYFEKWQSKSGVSIRAPGNAKCIENWQEFWNAHKDSLPSPWNFPTPALKMDMIYPLPKAVGRALIQQFYPKREGSTMDPYVVEEILNQYGNQHCLVQPCLGLDVRPRKPGDFSLNNFELSLADMQSIGINVADLAAAMGEAFGLLHYSRRLFCDGIKFAFGTSLENKQHRHSSHIVNLDETDEDGLVMADTMLEPDIRKFIPSPLKSPALYNVFKDAYIGQAILKEIKLLPYMVMKNYERRVAREFL